MGKYEIMFYKQGKKGYKRAVSITPAFTPPLFILEQQIPAMIIQQAETDPTFKKIVAYKIRKLYKTRPPQEWSELDFYVRPPLSDEALAEVGIGAEQ